MDPSEFPLGVGVGDCEGAEGFIDGELGNGDVEGFAEAGVEELASICLVVEGCGL